MRNIRLSVLLAFLLWLAGNASGQTLLAKPYVQPGPAPDATGHDTMIIAWVTDATPGDFVVEYGWDGQPPLRSTPKRTAINLKAYTPPAKTPPKSDKPAADKDDDDDDDKPAAKPPTVPPQHYLNYAATLSGLPSDRTIWYRVSLGATVVREASFRSRVSADKTIHFTAVGDIANGKEGQDAIAYHMAATRPDFVLALGDIVYKSGRASEYMSHFWRTYTNGDGSDTKSGTSLFATSPAYALLGNHDADTSLNIYPDALAAYYFFHAPTNGPGVGKWNTPIGRDAANVAAFRAAAASYPHLGFYSFDNGPAHFLVLDSNGYVKTDDPALVRWIESDLAKSTARWKIVATHAPAFHSSPQHYSEQKLRRLAPLFEKHGVSLVLAGHVHNYQRSFPLRFAPNPPAPGEKTVSGAFTIDRTFDGKTNTQPDGVIYMVAGGGGGTLYKDPLEKTAKTLRDKYKDNYADYTARHVADRYSFLHCQVSPTELTLRAIDGDGKEIESIRLTKP